jgi:CBS domain-containing protein
MSSHQVTPTLGHVLTEAVMRPGVISCGPETDVSTLARMMASNRVHSIVVTDAEQHPTWGLVTALDLVAATLPGIETDAGALAGSEIVTVDAADTLERAAQLMTEHQLTHLLVTARGRPVGVISTLDIVEYVAQDGEG